MLPEMNHSFAAQKKPTKTTKKANALPTSYLLHWSLLLGSPLIALICFEGFSRGELISLCAAIGRRPLMFLLDYGLLFCLFGLFALLRSDRLRMCCTILVTSLLSALGIINCYKIQYRFEPLLLTDIFQIGEMQNSLQELPMQINWMPSLALGLSTILALVLSILFLRRKRPKRSVLWPILSCLLLCALIPCCTFANPFIGTQTDLVEYSRAGGSLFAMIAMEKQRLSSLHSNYTPAAAEKAYEEIKEFATPDSPDMPNIIFILSESFTDQEHLGRTLHFTDTLMPFYDQLVKTCTSGEIYVPKMGGGTSETEFEVLTGLQSKYSLTPYSVGLPELHSVASVMRERGYKSTALHWYTGVFYNRYKNLRMLGFDEFYTTDTTNTPFTQTGRFVSDAEHYRSILQTIEKSEQKDFIFCITMQNHGPYDYEDFSQLYGATAPFTNLLSDHSLQIATNYCYLLRQSDNALRDFIGELSILEEPTLVVFFGDHIPPLGTDFYKEVDMPLDGDLGHLAPYFIWSNVENTPQHVSMQSWQLGAFALSGAGVSSDPFLGYIEKLRKDGVDEDDRYQLLSYDALFGDQAVYNAEKFSIQSPAWQIGGELRLLGVDAIEIDGDVYVAARIEDSSQAYKLLVNGQVNETMCLVPTDEPFMLQCVLSNSRGVVYNLSRTLTFASTDELLEQSGEMHKIAIPLDAQTFTITQEERDYFVAETSRPFSASASALTMDGKRFRWQHKYAFQTGGQFYVQNSEIYASKEPLSLTISKADFEGYELSSEGISRYLQDHHAQLFLLGDFPED